MQQFTARRPSTLLFLFCSTALVPMQLAAQEDVINLGEIVVGYTFDSEEVDGYVAQTSSSATKTSAPLVETPVTVNVVTEDQFTAQGAESVAEALAYTPNVLTNYRGESTIYDETFIRGFTYAPKYLNGSQFGTAGFGQLDPFLLERVEVAKGPNSVIFGRSIPGGVVNMGLKGPSDQAGNKVVLSFGSDGYRQIGTDLRGDLNEDGTLRYRFVATAWDKDLQGDTFGQSRIALAPSLTWDIAPETQLEFDVIYQDDPEAGQRNFYTQMGTLEPTVGGYFYDRDLVSIAPEYDDLNRETKSVGARLRHEFANGILLRSSLRYTDIQQLHNGVYVDNIDTFGSPDDVADLGVVWIEDDYQQFTFDNSLEAQFDAGGSAHTLLFGVDYQKQSNRRNNRTNWVTPLQFDLSNPTAITIADNPDQYLNPDWITDTSFEQIGVYLQDHIEIGALNILLSGRYDWTSTTTTNVTLGTTDETDTGAFSGRVGLSYELDNGLVPFASYATSFEPSTDYDVNGNLLDPSEARQFEVGAKWASADGRMLFTASYFDIEQTNIVESDPVNGWPHMANIGTRQSRGFELEAKADLTDRLSIIVAYGEVDAEMTAGQYAGFKAQRIPQRNAGLWVSYEFMDGLEASAGVRHMGQSYGDYAETTVVPDYTLLDLGFSADLGQINANWEGATANVAITNVTNERYVSSCVSGYEQYCWYGEGREVKVSLTHEW